MHSQLSLAGNNIGGYYDDNYDVIYTAEGPKAIADALLVNSGLTSVC